MQVIAHSRSFGTSLSPRKMSKTNIQTNLLGRICILTEEAKAYAIWHEKRNWHAAEHEPIGDFAKLPGGEYAQGEIVAVYLVDGGRHGTKKRLLAAVRWTAGGNIHSDIDLSWLRVV